MATETQAGGGRTWAADVLSSLVVFMVALPLCIGIAQACGLPPMTGIVTGIVGGILVGALSGSPLQVSGPAAGLIVLVIQFLDDAQGTGRDRAGAVVLLGVTIFLAGLIQIGAGVLRVGQWFRAVSPAVVEGMLAGIGLTIFAKQFHDMVDDQAPKEVLQALVTIPQAIWKAVDPPAGVGPNHQEAAIIGVLTILVLATWKSVAPKRLRIIPAAVIGVLLAVLVNEFGRPVFEGLGMRIGPAVDDHGGIGVERVEIKANVLESFRLIAWPGWEVFGLSLIWKGAITFALIASAESLLCATAVDTMHQGPRTRYDRELVAQGVGNAVCGAIGALPMTGVIVRSSANVDAGAKTRLSTILHGLWLLLFVALLPGVLSRIPAAALAAILVYTGWKLLNVPRIARMWRESKSEALIYVATAAAIVLTDLLTGVVVGIVLSAAKLLYIFSHLRVIREDEPAAGRVHLTLEGAATFIRLPVLAEALDALPRGQQVYIHLDHVVLVDHAVLDLLTAFQKQYEGGGGRVAIDWDRLRGRLGAAQAPSGSLPVLRPRDEVKK
ncbi:MAG: SulP family inorganic anion transporter [Isosphaera sp.]|nr:SulP family inorganic anion transporter [Isosphaera sp.]